MKEQIKTIVGTTYRVSDRGIIINKHGRPLIGCKGNKQHVTHLMINKKVKHVQTCRLIWETFNGVIPKGKVVDHIDGNVFNNALTNLRLTTRSFIMKRETTNNKLRTPRRRYCKTYDKLS
jgi:hypothetical protein